jgi:hypothetical protein
MDVGISLAFPWTAGAPHCDFRTMYAAAGRSVRGKDAMYYEPDTVWGRTVEGDEEVAIPRSGLSLVQRRVLRELAQPRTFAAIAAKHNMEAPKLENELIWLAERRLVAFQRPGAPGPRTAPRIHLLESTPEAANAPNAAAWQRPPLAVCLLAVLLGVCSVLLILT